MMYMNKLIPLILIFCLVSKAGAQTLNPEFGDFNPIQKNSFDDSFEITPPLSQQIMVQGIGGEHWSQVIQIGGPLPG